MDILDTRPDVKRKGRTSKYDYDAFFSQGDKFVKLTAGTDFNCSVATMRHNVSRQAVSRDIKIETLIIPADQNDGNDALTLRVLGKRTEKKTTNKK